MDVILVMCIGILIGKRFRQTAVKKGNEKIQLVCTLLLIFSMGVLTGREENFFEELSSLGTVSFLFFLIPTVLSILFVYGLTKKFLEKTKESGVRGRIEGDKR